MTASPVVAIGTEPGVHESAGRLFDALARHAFAEYATLGAIPSDAQVADGAIAGAWPAATVVSFDIFDTLVVRKVASPRDVFLQLATPAPFNAWGVPATVLASLRQDAEMQARRAGMSGRGSGEVTLTEIHAVLATLLGRGAHDVPAMVRAEQQVELALCVGHPHLQRYFARAVQDGRTIWCVSDTYHDEAFLRELLTACGYALDGVRVVSSAERRMCKGDGRLLRAVAAEAGVDPAAVLHIGDHPTSDVSIPLSQGFMAVLHPWAASRHSDRPAQQPADAIALGLAQIGSRAVEPPFPFWWRFGYSVAGPLLAGFASWLHDALVRDGVDRAYFLLRDGEIMRDVYLALTEGRTGPAVSLLESSRRAFMVPALEAGCASVTQQLLACEHPRPAGEFLERIGLSAAEFPSAFRAVGLTPDEVVGRTDAVKMGAMAAVFGRREVAQAIVARSRQERRLLWQYLTQEGVLAPGRIALVDIGWNGTIQKALLATARLERSTLDVRGYYLGTQPAIAHDLDGSHASGYLFAAGEPAEHARAVLQLQQLVEFICTTTRGSLRGFRMEKSRVVPVHGAGEHAGAQRDAVAQVRAGAVAFAHGLAREQQVFGVAPLSAEAALRHLARTIQQPTPEEAAHIGDIRHGEGMGTDRARALAAFSDGPFTAASLERDLMAAYWPVGLLARREPAAMALRALRWMRGH